MNLNSEKLVKLALPKGRIQAGVNQLFSDANIKISTGSRAYRPSISISSIEAKILKPQDIVQMLSSGSRDIGFTGLDWVQELEAELVELLDTKLDPVRIVAAAPASILENGKLPNRKILIASEYQNLTKRWINDTKLNADYFKCYGATEVFPPEDADCIVDNTSTGSTLKANNLEIVDTLLKSSTRLFANPKALEDKSKREEIENLVLLLKAVCEARTRVMLEINVSSDDLNNVVEIIPCLRQPTISELNAEAGYAIRAAVPRNKLAHLIPEIKKRGGTDIVVSNLSQIVP